MNKLGQGIDTFAVDQNIRLDKIRFSKIYNVVVERPIPLGNGLEFVIKIVNHFSKREFEYHLQASIGQVLIILVNSPVIQAELHDDAHIPVRNDDSGTYKRFFGALNGCGIRI